MRGFFIANYYGKLRRMRWAGHVARMGEKNNKYRVLLGKLEEEITLKRRKR
jgi:hypothetical protein